MKRKLLSECNIGQPVWLTAKGKTYYVHTVENFRWAYLRDMSGKITEHSPSKSVYVMGDNIEIVTIGENLMQQKPRLYVGMTMSTSSATYQVIKVVNDFTANVRFIKFTGENIRDNV